MKYLLFFTLLLCLCTGLEITNEFNPKFQGDYKLNILRENIPDSIPLLSSVIIPDVEFGADYFLTINTSLPFWGMIDTNFFWSLKDTFFTILPVLSDTNPIPFDIIATSPNKQYQFTHRDTITIVDPFSLNTIVDTVKSTITCRVNVLEKYKALYDSSYTVTLKHNDQTSLFNLNDSLIINFKPNTNYSIEAWVTDQYQNRSNVMSAIIIVKIKINFPTFTTHPQNQTVKVGEGTVFSVVATGEKLQYQWQENGIDLPNTNSSTLSIQNVNLSDNGNTYRCIVSNNVGSVTSNSATLTVVENTFPPKITKQPQSTTKNENEDVTFLVEYTAGNPKKTTFQWQKNGVDLQGATEKLYTLQNISMADDSSFYRCVVSNDVGSDISDDALLRVKLLPPVITVHPQSFSVTEGKTARLTIVAKGTSIEYQWQRNEIDVLGATEKTHTLQNISMDDNNSRWRCIITNGAGTDTSKTVILTVVENDLPPKITQQPTNDTAKLGGKATFFLTSKGTNLKYQWLKNGNTLNDAISNIFEISTTTKGENGSKYQCIVYNSVGSDYSDIVNLSVHWPPSIVKHPKTVSIYAEKQVKFTVEVEEGNPDNTQYQWYENDQILANETGQTLEFVAAEQHTGAKYKCEVSNSVGKVMSKEAVLNVYYIKITTHPKSKSVIYGKTVKFNIIAEGNPTDIKYQWKRNGENIGENVNYYIIPAVEFENIGEFYCDVSNSAGTLSSDLAFLEVKDQQPSITTQPSSQESSENSMVTFNIEATGTNLKYEWFSGNTKVSDKKEYSFVAKKGENGKEYGCKVSNSAGSVKSDPAKLTVWWLNIDTQPKDKKVIEGDNVSFSVVVSSNPNDVVYQWYKDGDNINQTSATCTYGPVLLGDHEAKFFCKISNGKLTDNSNTATLEVEKKIGPPVWNTQKTYELDYDVAKFDMREYCSDVDTKFENLVFTVNNDIASSKGDLELDGYILKVDVSSGSMPSGTYKTSITVSDGDHSIKSPVFSYEY